MSIETIIKRATAEHIVVQGRENALRALIIAETTDQGLTSGMDYTAVARATGADSGNLTIVTAPEPDKTWTERPAGELVPVGVVGEPVRVLPRVGDIVQIAFPDVQEFSKPRMVTALSNDGKTAFVEAGDPRGYPIQWLEIQGGSGTGRYGDGSGTGRYGDNADHWTQTGDGSQYPGSYGVGPETTHAPFVPLPDDAPDAPIVPVGQVEPNAA